MNPLEKQLQSWTPRRPSAKIARRLFAKAAPAPVFLRRAEVWNWLTPAAACALTVMVTLFNASHREARLSHADKASYFATLMVNTASSNGTQTLVLSKRDENLEWNVWPRAVGTQAVEWAAAHAGLDVLSVIPTNH